VIAVSLKIALWLAALGVLLPLLAGAVSRQRARLVGREAPAELVLFGETFSGGFTPIVEAFRALTRAPVPVAGAGRIWRIASPFLWLAPWFVILAVVPFGGVFRFGDTRIALVVAETDVGLVLVWLAFAANACVRAASRAAGGRAAEGRGSGWLAAQAAAARAQAVSAAAAVSVLGMVLWAGSLDLQAIVLAQDAVLPVFAAPTAVWQAVLAVPAWGAFVQPLGFALFVVSLLVAGERPPDHPADAGSWPPGPAARLANGLARPVGAALVVALFLGGGAVPYLPAERLIGAVSRVYGEGFATGFVLLLQVGTFFAKVVGVALVQAALSDRWSHRAAGALGTAAAPDRFVRRLLPLALANAGATAVFLVASGGGAA